MGVRATEKKQPELESPGTGAVETKHLVPRSCYPLPTTPNYVDNDISLELFMQ